jgi:murein DD-endopeptidase MepM/ murein hydrolase activator NlpD
MSKTPPTDRSLFGVQTGPFIELAGRLARTVSHYHEQSRVDQNKQAPKVQLLFGKRYYETAPVPLLRLMSSPVAQSGPYSRGPSGERVIASGWADARSDGYDNAVNTNVRHMGLDFTANFGETVYAAADGQVTFTGYQHRVQHGVRVDGPHEDTDGNVRNRANQVVALGAGSPDQIQVGFGGIIIFVNHTGDFANYRTEYMHLSDVLVKQGDHVLEGQPIGKIGGTGGYYGHFTKGFHLHFQVSFLSGNGTALVRPTALVPNYWPGPNHEDSTNAPKQSGYSSQGSMPVGQSVVAGAAAGQIQSIDRATDMENQRSSDYKRRQAEYSTRVANQLTAHQTQLFEALAKFQGGTIEVQNAMTFDFTTGTWKPDGKAT